MTLRKRMHVAIADIQTAAKNAESEFARFHPAGTHADVRASHDRHIEGLREAYRIICEFGNAPEDFEALLKLRAETPKEFAAFMLWVNEELKPTAPADAKAAA